MSEKLQGVEGTFDEFLNAKFAALRHRVVDEFKREINKLRSEVTRLASENGDLRHDLYMASVMATARVAAAVHNLRPEAHESPEQDAVVGAPSDTKPGLLFTTRGRSSTLQHINLRTPEQDAVAGAPSETSPAADTAVSAYDCTVPGATPEPDVDTRSTPEPRKIRVSRANSVTASSITMSEGSVQIVPAPHASLQVEHSARESVVSDFSHASEMSIDKDFEILPEWKFKKTDTPVRRRQVSVSSVNSLELATTFGSDESRCDLSERWQDFEHCLARFMVRPGSITHVCWGCAGLVLILYDVVVSPLDVAGLLGDADKSWGMTLMSWLLRLFWTLDIVKSFLTGRLGTQGTVEMKPLKVAKYYARTWLPLDFLCVACDWISPFFNDAGRSGSAAVSGFRFLRIVRLVRLAKISEIEGFITEYVRSETVVLMISITKIIFVLVGVAHLIACAWYAIGAGGSSSSPGWVHHLGVHEEPLNEQYLYSLNWSMAQFTGNTMGDPQNAGERLFSMLVLLLTFLLSALFVSSITTSMTRLMIVAGKQSSQLLALRRYLFGLHISASLMVRMQRNAQHALAEQKKTAPDILGLISESLQVDYHYELNSPIIFLHPFFLHYHEVNHTGVRRVCHSAVRPISLSRGDVLCNDCETPTRPRMFFVLESSGLLRYRQQGSPQQYLAGGEWACEPVLWTTWMHCGTLSAVRQTKLLEVDAHDVRKILGPFPSKHAFKYAEAFVEELNSVDRAQLSDLWMPDFHTLIAKSALTSSPTSEHARRVLHSPFTPSSVASRQPLKKSSTSVRRSLSFFRSEAQNVVSCLPHH